MLTAVSCQTDLDALCAAPLPIIVGAPQVPALGGRFRVNPAAAQALLGRRSSRPRWTDASANELAACGLDPALLLAAAKSGCPVGTVHSAPGGARWRVACWSAREPATGAAQSVMLFTELARPAPGPDGSAGDTLDMVESATALGVSWLDPATGLVELSAGAARLWGMGSGPTVRATAELLDRVHPEDREDLTEAPSPAHPETRVEFRIVPADGEVRHLVRVARRTSAAGRTRILQVERDITDQRLLARDLAAANTAAEAAAKSKSEFLALMSHELRTPLNAVMGFAQVMTSELFGPLQPKYLDYSREINSSAEHLLTLINDILDLSRMEAARYQLNKDWINLGRLAEDTARMMGQTAERRSVALDTEVGGTIRIWGEARAVRQILLNLLSNAIKFTDAGGRVEVVVGEAENGDARLEVRDTGIGIPADDLPRICEPFVQSRNVVGRDGSGTGLGLAIVTALVDLHGGRMTIESKVGKGTRVSITLPSGTQ